FGGSEEEAPEPATIKGMPITTWSAPVPTSTQPTTPMMPGNGSSSLSDPEPPLVASITTPPMRSIAPMIVTAAPEATIASFFLGGGGGSRGPGIAAGSAAGEEL